MSVGQRPVRSGRGDYTARGPRRVARVKKCAVPDCQEDAYPQATMCPTHRSENRRESERLGTGTGRLSRRLPLAPLRAIIAKEITLFLAESSTPNAMQRNAAGFYRYVLGMNGVQVKKLLSDETLHWGQADRICIALGTHPALVWPVEWVQFDDAA